MHHDYVNCYAYSFDKLHSENRLIDLLFFLLEFSNFFFINL